MMDSIMSLAGKTVLITGASSGIGQGVALLCAKLGAQCVITARNEGRLEETLKAMEGEGHEMIIADLTDFRNLKANVEQMPKLDGIVHCAGIGQRKMAKLLDEEDIDQVMNINFKAPVMLQTEILKQKKLNKCASIVYITSIAAESPSIGNSIYSASKGAIVSYANCLAVDLAPRKIRVNCISPAMVWTDLVLADGTDVEQLKEDEQTYPLKRYGQPEDIANLAVYMLSDASTWMTGSNVNITGGGHFVVR